MNGELTDRQKRILDFIKQYIAGHGYAPSSREIVDFMGASGPNAAEGHLRALETKGYITRAKRVARGIVVLK
jgi:repressor LexA